MSKGQSKRLVVDASVANSAGQTTHPISKACRETLEIILHHQHKVVMTKEVSDEWKKHQSRYSLTWLASMTARKRVVRLNIEQDNDLRRRIEELEMSETDFIAIMKDVHLAEAALITDHTVLSRDDKMRVLLKRICKRVGSLKVIIWVNPANEREQAIQWLTQGADADKHRSLGHEDE